jgi:hypothetical protein
MIFSTTNIHDVDRVSLDDASGLVTDDGKTVQVRHLTIRARDVKFVITLFSDDARLLDVHEEG